VPFSPYVSDRAKRKGLYGTGPLPLSPSSMRNNVSVLSFFQNSISEFVKFVRLRSIPHSHKALEQADYRAAVHPAAHQHGKSEV
jgi:hypothetical protein